MWLTHKHKPHYYQVKWIYVMAPFFNAFIINTTLIATTVYLGLIDPAQAIPLCFIVFSYSLLESLIYSLYLVKYRLRNNTVSNIEDQPNNYTQETLELECHVLPEFDIVEYSNGNIYLSSEVIDELSSFKDIVGHKSKVGKISSLSELVNLPANTQVIILDMLMNDTPDINKTFATAYETLQPGGFAYLAYQDIPEFKRQFLESKLGWFRPIKNIIFYLYFIMLPKIPYLNFWYGLTTFSDHKAISQTEIHGRLAYAGYDVEREIKLGDYSYMIVRKTKTLSENPSPSYYPLVMLNRVSMHGTIIKIHKIRAMYPYSEFLQKKISDESGVDQSGKFENDYRITKWGSYFRKYWIDEIPQFIDWTRGKIKLVGIRAMSQQYFDLYPQEYKELYFQVKPGIISPIFDEGTDGFSDIVKIEKEYLVNYLNNPLRTDIKYFFNTLKQMISGARSK